MASRFVDQFEDCKTSVDHRSDSKKGCIQYRVLYEFIAKDSDQLTIKPDQIINGDGSPAVSGWLMGELRGKSGFFPESYVEKINKICKPITPPKPALLSKTGICKFEIENSRICENKELESIKFDAKIMRAIAIYSLNAQENSQLSFNEGDEIIIKEESDDWYFGEMGCKSGWVPKSYFKAKNHSEEKNLSNKSQAEISSSKSGSSEFEDEFDKDHVTEVVIRGTNERMKKRFGITRGFVNPKVKTMDVIPLKMGSSFLSITKTGKEPFFDGTMGSRSQSIDDLNLSTMIPINNVSAYQHRPEEFYHEIYINTFGKQSNELEEKRMTSIMEFFHTENSYIEGIELVLDTLPKFILVMKISLPGDILTMFSRLEKILAFNQKFYKSLKLRIHEYKHKRDVTQIASSSHPLIISDIVIKFLSSMNQIYTQYFIAQKSAKRNIEHTSRVEPIFKKVLEAAVQGAPLESQLIKPMQRITKYQLLLGSIAKQTENESQHPDHYMSLQAFESANNLCSQVNSACKAREDEERFEWLKEHVQMDGFQRIFSFNSQTEYVGQRKLIKAASLAKANSGRKLVGFLFNDFLFLTICNNILAPNIMSIFEDEKAMSSYYRTYKGHLLMLSCIQLNTMEQFESKPNQHLFQIRYKDFKGSRNEMCVINLSTDTDVERSAWVQEIDKALRYHRNKEREMSAKKRMLVTF